MFRLSVWTILFTLVHAGIMSVFFNNNLVRYILLFLVCFIFYINCLYWQLYQMPLSFYSLLNGNVVLKFSQNIISYIFSNLGLLLIFFLPFIISFFIKKMFFKVPRRYIVVIVMFAFYILVIGCINFTNDNNKLYNAYNLYYKLHNSLENIKVFGVLTNLRLDIERCVFGFNEQSFLTYEENGQTFYFDMDKYNVTDIDFDSLIENEDNSVIKEIHEYIKSQKPTAKNSYTGLLKGKNLIVIMAESLHPIAIDEDLTPTLYDLANANLSFTNFYSPLFPVSTSDGQYLTDTSLLPAENTWTMEHVDGNYYPYTYANMFEQLGYNTYAYHNYEYDYYKRNTYFENLGYDKYLACGNGLEKLIDCGKYTSDKDMIEATINDYIKDDSFLVYYTTFSGHEYLNNNYIVKKHWNKVKDLPYSTIVKYYLATQIELDEALSYLIDTLKDNNKLDDTVIMIFGDHYPYMLSLEEMNEVSSYELDDVFERSHMSFILYNSGLPHKEITKHGSNLDVLPTILNLFGFNFDSRLLMGRDLLTEDDSEQLVIFSSRSFITDLGRYNSYSEKFISNDGKVKEDYIANIKNKIYLKYRYSRLIFENNYYKHLFLNMEK